MNPQIAESVLREIHQTINTIEQASKEDTDLDFVWGVLYDIRDYLIPQALPDLERKDK